MKLLLLSSITLVALGAPRAAAEQGLRTWKDIPYLGELSTAEHRLDIWAPREVAGGTELLPVVLYIHGGGWIRGDKSRVASKPEGFTSNGYVFVSANYRLLPAGRHPENAKDIAQAIHWLRQHIPRYGGDPENISLIGHSSGAHLVALVATDERLLQSAQEELTALRGAIVVDTAALDISHLIAKSDQDASTFYQSVFGRRRALWNDASPAFHIQQGRSAPAFLLLSAGSDARLLGQMEGFAQRLRGAGLSVSLTNYPDHSHHSINRGIGSSGHAPTVAILDFLNAQRSPR